MLVSISAILFVLRISKNSDRYAPKFTRVLYAKDGGIMCFRAKCWTKKRPKPSNANPENGKRYGGGYG